MSIFLDSVAVLVLGGLLAFLAILGVSIIFHLRWGVPYVPTPMPIVRTMIALAELKPDQTVIDLGAGDGRLLIEALRSEPGIHAIGYEGALAVWMLAKIRIFFSGFRTMQMLRKNFFAVDLSNADVIFLYLSSHIMTALVPKFMRELRPGTLIISHAFQLPGCEPVRSAEVPMFYGIKKTKVRCYRWMGDSHK